MRQMAQRSKPEAELGDESTIREDKTVENPAAQQENINNSAKAADSGAGFPAPDKASRRAQRRLSWPPSNARCRSNSMGLARHAALPEKRAQI
jgi:hypothetical protein